MDTIKQIKQIPILDVAKMLGIKLRGNKAMCFKGHDSKTPSLTFTTQKNLFHCFGCGIGGSNIDLVMQYNNISTREGIAWLKDKFIINSPSKQKTNYRQTINKVQAHQNVKNTTEADPAVYRDLINKLSLSEKSRKYLNGRGFSDKTIEKFWIKDITNPADIANDLIKIYGAPRIEKAGLIRQTYKAQKQFLWRDYTILLPFIKNNNVIYLQGRRLAPNGPKYLGLKGISKPIYNISVIESMVKGDLLLICEGIPDVLAAHEMGYPAIGILGAHSFKEQWANLLLPFDLIIVPDNDLAGTGFGKKLRKMFLDQGKIVQIVQINDVKDLAELHLKQRKGN